MNIYLDIETIPTQSDALREEIAASITPPGNISKAETIAAWEAEKKPALVREAIAKTALDGATGHICCIGWADDSGNVQISYADNVEKEAATLASFVGRVERMVDIGRAFTSTITIIGHNVRNFDIRFLWQRAIVLGVRMPRWFPSDPTPWGNDVFDTMTAFAGPRGMIGMDRLCRALGIEGKGDIDGSMVGDLWAAGKFETIAEYCEADVERVRAIYRRMMVAYGRDAA